MTQSRTPEPEGPRVWVVIAVLAAIALIATAVIALVIGNRATTKCAALRSYTVSELVSTRHYTLVQADMLVPRC